jgi:hypothetical protein
MDQIDGLADTLAEIHAAMATIPLETGVVQKYGYTLSTSC